MAQIFYIPQATTSWIMHFTIICDEELNHKVHNTPVLVGIVICSTALLIFICQEIKSYYSSKRADVGPSFEVAIHGHEVVLDIPMDGIQLCGGWFVCPLHPPRVSTFMHGLEVIMCQYQESPLPPLSLSLSLFPSPSPPPPPPLSLCLYLSLSLSLSIYIFQLLRHSVDNYKPGMIIPSCEIELEWKGGNEPMKLNYKVLLRGVYPVDTFIRIIRHNTPQGQRKECYTDISCGRHEQRHISIQS